MVMMGGMATERQGSSEEKKETKWTGKRRKNFTRKKKCALNSFHNHINIIIIIIIIT